MAGKPKRKKPLKGGIGNEILSPEEASARMTGRLEYSKMPLQDKLRKRMQVGDEDSRRQIAEATLAAAYQHRSQPDPATNIYGRQFTSLTNSEQEALLSVLPEAEAQVVRDTFGDNVIVDEPPPPTQAKVPDTVQERARAAARRAMEEMGAKTIPVVDLDKYSAPETSGKTVLPVKEGDKVRTVDDTQGWTKAQVRRGYRRVLYGPKQPGSAPVSTIEVIADRKAEFTTKQPPRRGEVRRKENPNYGKTRDSVVVSRQSEGQVIDRVTPSEFDELSPEAKKAAAQGGQIMEYIRQMEEQYDPDFLQTAEGKRLVSKITELANAHPEAVSFMEDPSLGTLPDPGQPPDTLAPEQKLPIKSTLSYRIGDPAMRERWETRGDRRMRDGIPPDAPNRQMWRQVNEIEVDPRTGEPTGFRAALPPPDEIKDSLYRPIRRNLDYEAKKELPDNSPEGRAAAEEAAKRRATELAELPDDADLPDAEVIDDIFVGDADAEPVMDISGLADNEAGPQAFYVDKGTATGSPSRVKSDRDFALREGRSKYEKLQEKLWRLATEFSDSSQAPVDTEGRSVGADLVDGGLDKNQIRKRASGASTKKPSQKVLQLDGLVPQWRAAMYFQEGDQIVVRRPRADEIANELAFQADLGPDVAAGLIPHVQASMDALESVTPDANKYGRAKSMIGMVIDPNERAMADMQKKAMSFRMPGDTRPIVSQQSLAAAQQAGMQPVSVQPSAPGAAMERLLSLASDADTAAPETAAPQAPTENPFAAFLRNAGGGGSTTKTIAGMLSLLGAGAASQAQAGELPGVEYLAMGGKPRPRKSVAQVVGAGQQQTTPTTFTPVTPAPTTTQAATATAPATVANPPQTTATSPAAPAVNAQWSPSGLTQQQIDDLRTALGINQPAATTPPTAPAPTAKPKPGYFDADPVYATLKAVTKGTGKAIGKGLYNAGRYLPSATAAGAAIAGAPYYIPPIIRGARFLYEGAGMGSGEQQQQPKMMTDIDMPGAVPSMPAAPQQQDSDPWDSIYGPQMQPEMDDSTSTVSRLRNMLAKGN